VKKIYKLFRIVAFAALVGFSVAGCSDGGSIVSTMGAPGIGEIKDNRFQDGDKPVDTLAGALELFSGLNVSGLGNLLSEADEVAFDRVFITKNNTKLADFLTLQMAKKSTSYSIDINDSVSLHDTQSTVAAGNIKGSSKASISLNKQTIADFVSPGTSGQNYGLKSNGDSVSISASANRTFTISSGFINVSNGSNDNCRVSGIIKTEYSLSFKETLTDAANEIETGSSSGVSKVSAALVISNGTKAAKFRFSAAVDASANARTVTGSNSLNYSDLEVYNESNSRIFVVPASLVDYDDWLALASIFVYGDVFESGSK